MTDCHVKIPRPISVNSMFANRQIKGQRGRVKTERYRVWRQNAIQVVKGIAEGKARPLPTFTGRVRINLFVPERGVRMDLDNAAKAYIDLFVHLGVIPDDSKNYVRGVSLDWIDADIGEALITEIRE